MAQQIQLRRDTAANWTSVNPVLAQGEPGYESDTDKLKIGDGVTHWTSLAYIAGGSAALAPIANNTVLGNNSGATASPTALTAAQVKTLLAIAAADVAGLAVVATSGSASDLVAGTLPAGRFPALTGDVTTSAGALAATIAPGTVTLAKMANLAANSFLGNNTGTAATPIALTAAQAKVLLAITPADVSGLKTGAQVNLAVGTVAPSSPAINDLWVDTN